MATPTQQRAVYNQQLASTLSYDERVDIFNPVIWLDEFSSIYQDDAGTTPADAVGEAVGRWSDRSGNGFHATSSLTARPVLASSGGVLVPDFDGSNDHLVIANNAAFADLEAWTVAVRVSAASAGGGNDGYFWLYTGVAYGAQFSNNLGALSCFVDGAPTNAITTTSEGVSADVDSWLFFTFNNSGDREAQVWNPYELDTASVTTMSGALVKPTADLYIGNNSAGGTLAPFDGLYRAFILFPSVLTPQNMRWLMNGAG